jgi:hypothetical protein
VTDKPIQQAETVVVMSFSLTRMVADKLKQWPDGMRSMLLDAMCREKLGMPPTERMQAVQQMGVKT